MWRYKKHTSRKHRVYAACGHVYSSYKLLYETPDTWFIYCNLACNITTLLNSCPIKPPRTKLSKYFNNYLDRRCGSPWRPLLASFIAHMCRFCELPKVWFCGSWYTLPPLHSGNGDCSQCLCATWQMPTSTQQLDGGFTFSAQSLYTTCEMILSFTLLAEAIDDAFTKVVLLNARQWCATQPQMV